MPDQPPDHLLDSRLRKMARASLAHDTDAVDTDADLAELQSRLASGEPFTAPPSSRPGTRWLAAAAATLLVIGGIVAIAWTRATEDGDANTPPPASINVTVSPTSPTAVTTVPPEQSAPATSTPNATFPIVAVATADPAAILAGDVVTITPRGVIQRACADIVSVRAVGGASHGQIYDGRWIPAPDNDPTKSTMSDCVGTTSDSAVSLVVPVDMPPGNYELCLTQEFDPEACAAVTVDTSTGSSATGEARPADACWEQPLAPPTLPDGSVPAEPELSDAGAHWGTGGNAVIQFLGERQDDSFVPERHEPGAIYYGTIVVGVVPVGDPPVSEIMIVVLDNRDQCVRSYNVRAGIELADARTLALRWAIGWWTGRPAGDPTPPLGIDVYGSRLTDGAPEIVRFRTDGSQIGATETAHAEFDDLHRLADGSVVTLRYPHTENCGAFAGNAPLVAFAADGSEGPLHPDLAIASSFVVAPAGRVYATRLVCPAGGEVDLFEQLVRFDPATKAIEWLADYPALADSPAQPTNRRWLTAVSPDERYIAFNVAYAPEHSRYEIVATEAPTTPIDLPTSCDEGRYLVGPPQFVDGAIVVARRCWAPDDGDRPDVGYESTGGGELRIEAVYPQGVAWVAPRLPAELTAYSATLSLEARVDSDGRMWVLAQGIDDIENPSRAFLVGAGYDEWVELTREDIAAWALVAAVLIPAS